MSHKIPQFQCPSCDRSFHRADLLTRHQAKQYVYHGSLGLSFADDRPSGHGGDDDMSRLDFAQPSSRPFPAALFFRTQYRVPSVEDVSEFDPTSDNAMEHRGEVDQHRIIRIVEVFERNSQRIVFGAHDGLEEDETGTDI